MLKVLVKMTGRKTLKQVDGNSEPLDVPILIFLIFVNFFYF